MPSREPSVRASTAQRIGRYTVLRKLAEGGMAEIFLARASGIHGFEKLVVLKRVLPRLTGDAKFVTMFLDEARLVARLHHPNIAQVFDIGDDDGEYFFTMEYVHGQDLRSIVARAQSTAAPVPLELALGVVTQAAAALHYAHEQTDADGTSLGIVHRDVSPSNVLVSYDGAVKVIDFGVAKAEQRSEKTATGTIKGKVAYMSPEQCWGHPIDRRSDVFSLSTLLWELTTGKRLFYRDSDIAMMGAICFEDVPPPSSVVADCDPGLERIIMRGLHKEPDLRFQTAQALQVELEELCRERRLSTSPVRRAGYIETLFANEILSWRAAVKNGLSLAQHVSQLTPSATVQQLTRPATDSRVSGDAVERLARTRTAAAGPAGSDAARIGGEATHTSGGAARANDAATRAATRAATEPVEPPRASRAWLWLLAPVAAAAVAAVVYLGGNSGGRRPAIAAEPAAHETGELDAGATHAAPAETAALDADAAVLVPPDAGTPDANASPRTAAREPRRRTIRKRPGRADAGAAPAPSPAPTSRPTDNPDDLELPP